MSENKISGFSFFTLWFGAAVSLAEMMTGSLLAPLGLKKAFIAILIGHLIGGAIMATVGIIGFREKKPSLFASRISLGKYGSQLVAVLNILQLIGWTAIMLIQCAKALEPITSHFLGANSFGIVVVVVGILVAVWSLFVNNGIHAVNTIAVVLLGALSLVVLAVAVKGGQIVASTDSMSFGGALELSIIMPLSWVPLIADYTMSGKSEKGSFVGSFLGYFLGSSLMYVLGLCITLFTGQADPVVFMSSVGPGFIALFVVAFATITTTFMDVYSSAMSTLNLKPTLSKNLLLIIFSVFGIVLALFFPMNQYETFLYMIGSVFAPVFSVVLLDYFVFRKDWSKHSFNIIGLVSAAIGVWGYYFVTQFDLVVGSTIPAMLITGVIYLMSKLIFKGVIKS